MRFSKFLFAIFTPCVLLLASCVSKEKIVYFQPVNGSDDPAVMEITNSYKPVIREGDILTIMVSSISKEASEMFNPYSQALSYQQSVGSIAPTPVIGFLVDKSGNIQLPMVGTLSVKGLTTEETAALITKELEKYLISPTVNVRIANYKISILGEVARPADYTIPNEKVTIPQALAWAGDLTIYGKRDNILIIREENGKRTFARVDIRNRDIFNSEYYYLHPNDIVYVEPKTSKATSSETIYQLTPIVLSALTFLITIYNATK